MKISNEQLFRAFFELVKTIMDNRREGFNGDEIIKIIAKGYEPLTMLILDQLHYDDEDVEKQIRYFNKYVFDMLHFALRSNI